MAQKYGKSTRSQALNWYLHRITGTFLVFLLITHFWVQHYDTQVASVTPTVLSSEAIEQGQHPTYPEEAQQAVQAKYGTSEVTPYDVVMLRLADPVYAVLWKGFNLLFLLFALHHGFYGLSNILGDYIRHRTLRVTAITLSWIVALVLLVIGVYSIIVAGVGYTG